MTNEKWIKFQIDEVMVSMKELCIFSFLFCWLGNSYGFRLLNCSSDRIHEVSQKDGKATIRYDESKEITFLASDEVTIWCESNGVSDKCILEQKTRQNNKFKTECSYSYPPSCTAPNCNQNKRIEYSANDTKRCKFIIKGIQKEGTYKYTIS